MEKQEFIRIRTDAFLSFITNREHDYEPYLKAVEAFYSDGDIFAKEDNALLSALPMMQPPPYRMLDLDKPSPITTLNLPDGYDDYIAGQRRFTTTYAQDWPQAHDENQFGKRHPFSWELPTMPLLHGAQWGEPAFVDHLLHLIEEDEEGQSIIKTMKDMERLGIVPQYLEEVMGGPVESLYQLYHDDRNGRHSYLSNEDYMDHKRKEWSGNNSRLGLLSYMFGLEWQAPNQREGFMDLLKGLGETEDANHPDARKITNNIAAESGISWDRAKRSWFERFLPIARWWQRPSDRHGPVSTEDLPSDLHHFKSPFIREDDGVISPSFSHHWWLPFQHWGGVGRDSQSLQSLLKDTYPAAFSGWLGDELLGFLNDEGHPLNDAEDSYHGSGSSFFPRTANDPSIQGHPHRSAVSTGWEAGSTHPRAQGINRRRGLWSSVGSHHHVHPNEVAGTGKRMIVPSVAFSTNPNGLGRIIASHSDMGQPRVGPTRERHPGDEEYHTYHNDHYEKTDAHLGETMQEMGVELMREHGPSLFQPTDPTDIRANTIARGNIQQVAQAANYHLMRGQSPDRRSIAPVMVAGGITSQEVPLGPIHPESSATVPPVYLTGDKDAWGHKMPTTLAWNWDRENNGVKFDVKDKPFETLQRTAHEGHVHSVNPTILNHPMEPKQKDIPALFSTNEQGYSPVLSGDLWKSDDYEATGIFEQVIIPAHTIYDLSSVDDLKGFTGDWVIQKKPEGKRVFVVKSGGHLRATDGKGRDVNLPVAVRKGIREQLGNCTFDGVLKDGKFRAIDLLVHKGEDIHMEPLEDRLQILRTLYETNEAVSFPMPADCKFTDREGLRLNIDAIGGDVWLRDSTSTFMKGKEVHHKWVHYAPNGDHIGKICGPIPILSRRSENLILEYPGHTAPLVVKGNWDGQTLTLGDIEPQIPLAIHAEKQIRLWGPVAAHLFKYDISEITPYPPVIPTLKSTVFTRAALLDTSGNETDTQHALTHARKVLMDADAAMTSEQLIAQVEGLTDETLHDIGAEYGLERTGDGEWTVNEALDDEMVESKMGSPLARVSGSIQSGGWSGAMDMFTAPRGPTELTDEEATPMFDPRQVREGDMPPLPTHIKIQSVDSQGEEIEGELEIEGRKATLRYPQKTPKEAKEESEVQVPLKEEPEAPMGPPAPSPPQSG